MFCFPVKDVKGIWKNLKDEFRKQLQKTPRSGDEAPEPSSWKYYDSMLFLRDQFIPRRSTGNLTAASTDNANGNEDMDMLDSSVQEDIDSPSVINEAPAVDLDMTELTPMPTDTSETILAPPTTAAPKKTTEESAAAKKLNEEVTRTGFKKRLTTQAKIGQELVNIEKEKLKMKQSKSHDEVIKNDEDVGFFNSLLPHVKTLDPRKKFMFRMQVQQLLFDMAYSPAGAGPEPWRHWRQHGYQGYDSGSSHGFNSSRTPTPQSSTNPSPTPQNTYNPDDDYDYSMYNFTPL